MIALELSVPAYRYGAEEVLARRRYTFSLGRHVILGENGAGKTTLLKLLTGQVTGEQAHVVLPQLGIDASPAPLEFQRHLGYLPQDAGYPRRMQVSRFLGYAAWLKGVARDDLAQAVTSAMNVSDLHEFSDRRLGVLSGGTLRRVGLAAAIVHKPSLLVLDEPTAGLDPVQRSRVHTFLRDAPISVSVISTHLFEDAVALDGTLHILTRGAIRWSGTVERLCQGEVTTARLGSAFERILISYRTRGQA